MQRQQNFSMALIHLIHEIQSGLICPIASLPFRHMKRQNSLLCATIDNLIVRCHSIIVDNGDKPCHILRDVHGIFVTIDRCRLYSLS